MASSCAFAQRVTSLPYLPRREGEPLKDLAQYLEGPEGGPQQVEVRIAPEQMTAHNKQVKARQLWGCDVYTEDSDLVAVIMHMGFFSTNAGQPPYTVQEFRATVTPMPPQEKYESKSRNGLFSRAWTTPSKDCAYTVDSVKILTKIGTLVSLEPRLEGAPMLAPTFIPAHADRTMTTRVRGRACCALTARAAPRASCDSNLRLGCRRRRPRLSVACG